MKIRKKSLVMLVCSLVVISSMAFGTVAYLTDHASVTNCFTVGDVGITLDETQVDENGEPVPDPDYDPADPEHDDPKLRTDTENEYPLTPGGEYVKDPTMTVRAGSKKAYLRMVVTIAKAAEIDAIFEELKTKYPEKYPGGFVPGDFVTGRDNEKWVSTGAMAKDEALNTYTLEFRYFEPVGAPDTEDVTLPPLFESIKLPGELTNAHLTQLEGFFVDVEGHAIQTTGFADADEAWAAFDAETA